MVVYDLTPGEQEVAEIAWTLACKKCPYRTESNSILISSETDDGPSENYRMQSFIREWAAFGYAPAQSLLAKVAVKRLSI